MALKSKFSPVELVRRAYQAIGEQTDFIDGEPVASLFSLYAEDVIVYHGGKGPFAGAHHGRADIEATMRRAMEISQGTFREFDPHIFVGDDDFVYTAALSTAKRADGRELVPQVVAVVYRFKDGMIVEVWQHLADQAAWDEFWSS